jgi:hypothetical protein
MAHRAVDGIISGEITSMKQLRPLATAVLEWVQSNLLIAYADEDVKRKIKVILWYTSICSQLAPLWVVEQLHCRL